MIRFDLSIILDYTVLEASDFIFNIQPACTAQQRITWEQLEIAPDVAAMEDVQGTPGNRFLRVRSQPGALRVKYDAIVDVAHHFELPDDVAELAIRELPAEVLPFVYPSRYCPSDKFVPIAIGEFGTLAPGYARVEAVRRWVQGRTRFTPGASHASTSAMDTYKSGQGVCRDYAHLMIAMCRALNMPARFMSSVDYGADPALGPIDFHSCVEVFLGDRWYLFDPSGISPRTGLVRIGTGRDASDASFATIFGKVQWASPRISIRAEQDKLSGLTEPMRHDYAVSTDAGFSEVDESLAPRGAVLRESTPTSREEK